MTQIPEPVQAAEGRKTLHQRILDEIQGRIVSGEWPPGHRLPFEVDLARAWGVSRMTVNKVMAQLAAAGLIERRKKAGTVVAHPKSQTAILEVYDVEDEVQALGRRYSFQVGPKAERRPKPGETPFLDLGRGQMALHLVTRHFADGRPFCHEERLINLALVPGARQADFSDISPGKWLIRHIPWTSAEHRISAIAADPGLARNLGLEPGAPCLIVERRTWHPEGPVTAVRFAYSGIEHAVLARFSAAPGARP